MHSSLNDDWIHIIANSYVIYGFIFAMICAQFSKLLTKGTSFAVQLNMNQFNFEEDLVSNQNWTCNFFIIIQIVLLMFEFNYKVLRPRKIHLT